MTKITALLVLAALAFPTAALADSSKEGYGGPNNVVSGIDDNGGDEGAPEAQIAPTSDVAPDTAASAEPEEASTLPFTGADLGILVGAGVLLLGFGFGLRRLTHSPSQP